MMGEISEAEGSLGEDCGVTARIFEYLFSRIKMEEEERRDENLKFSCKCSFLEIYNEQITDLLEPSSTNLQLREDLGKGVYVENLVEHNVRTVSDVLKLLLQGATNRKIAATRMNSESSRSHSVFTCTIESLWEKDSLTRSRFARLNLVDLAGSERQKSSGAEGDRLKEAANINKSLSTLGLVIMSLVDLAHGKHRHVPYRDSRLTFLLQDSLGGNSKTMIIANVSPSLCSTNETLSTLKFAQRAKLIQNNAKVNEDASGDVTALQQEIRKLKVQLTSLLKNHDSCGALSDCISSLEESRYSGTCKVAGETRQDKCHCQVHNSLRVKVFLQQICGYLATLLLNWLNNCITGEKYER
jgi:kinesin family protein 15